eukprot:4810930-Pyramimonas_sp.AAC.1
MGSTLLRDVLTQHREGKLHLRPRVKSAPKNSPQTSFRAGNHLGNAGRRSRLGRGEGAKNMRGSESQTKR